MTKKTAILVNSSSNNNTGEKKWLLIKEQVLKMLPQDTTVIPCSKGFDIDKCIRDLLIDKNIECIISAGGDGSINYILNAIIKCKGESAPDISLGGIGLGSSNDFLKPASRFISGIPVKIDLEHSRAADIGKVTFTDQDSVSQKRYFLINASIGVTAEANQLFNRGDFFINRTKSRFINAAILYTAVKTILGYRNKLVEMTYDHVNEIRKITNISVVKNPNISGSFKYDQEIRQDDGYLGLNYFCDRNKLELLKTLHDLSRGRFTGKASRKSVLTKKIQINSKHHMALETDGEVQMANDIVFSIIPGAIQLAGK